MYCFDEDNFDNCKYITIIIVDILEILTLGFGIVTFGDLLFSIIFIANEYAFRL